MEKISLDELRSILKELGHTDEEVEEVISKKEKEETPETDEEEKTEVEVEVEAAPEEDSVAEGEGESAPVEEPEPVESESPEGEEPSDVAPVEEVAPVEPSPVEEETPVEEGEPVPPAEESALPEGVEEVDPNEPTPVEEAPTPAETGIDVQALLSDLEEQKKANAGLQSRIEALESALKEAGVLGESSLPSHSVGVDDGSRVPDYHDDDEAFEKVMSDLNRGY